MSYNNLYIFIQRKYLRGKHMNQKEVVITFETLYEILRGEKTREDLQKLDSTFFRDLAEYLKEKQQLYQETVQKTDIFSSTEKENLYLQLQNIKKLIKEIYDRRESKIINLALNKARTSSNAIDASSLLEEEKALFHHLVTTLEIHRSQHLRSITEYHSIVPERNMEQSFTLPQEEEKSIPLEQEQKEIQSDRVRLRFSAHVEQFIGTELEEYGPFDEGNEADIPSNIAEILISEGKAMQV